MSIKKHTSVRTNAQQLSASESSLYKNQFPLGVKPFISELTLKHFIDAVDSGMNFLLSITEHADDIDTLRNAIGGFVDGLSPVLADVRALELDEVPIPNIKHPLFPEIAKAIVLAGNESASKALARPA
jgi:hypothetical protein